jgi:hypothetical protein
VISNIVPSSLHMRNISPPILVARPKGYNSNPLNLFWELLMCITKQITLLLCIKKKWSMGLFTKSKLIVFPKLINIHITCYLLSHHVKSHFEGKFNILIYDFLCSTNEFQKFCGIIHFSISFSLTQWISPTLPITISL